MARKTEKLLIPKFDPSAKSDGGQCVRISRKAMALVMSLCSDTNRSQQDIASRLIEYAYEHAEVVEAKEDDSE